MQKIYDILKIIKEKGHNVQEIARKSGIKADKIYKWLDGKGSPKYEDGEKLKLWATNNLEKIPKKRYEKKETNGHVNETGNFSPNTFESLIQRQNLILDRQNNILERLANNVESKVEQIDASLNGALGQLDSVKLDLASGRHVVLQSLSRLEGKKEDYLVKQADNIKISMMAQVEKHGTSAGKHR